MIDTKLYQLLQQFDRITHNRLRKYIQSPYFNPNDTLSHLYELLREHIFRNKKNELEKEILWEQLKLDRSYDDVYFRKMVSDLMKLAEGFLAQEVYEEKKLLKAAFLIESAEQSNLASLYKSSIRQADKGMKQTNKKDAESYLFRYLVENNKFKIQELSGRSLRYNIEEVSDNLDAFYLAEKLRLFNTVLSQKRVASHTYRLAFTDAILPFAKTDERAFIPVELYYKLTQLYDENVDKDKFEKIKNYIIAQSTFFEQKEIREVYNQLLNFCIRNINAGKPEYLHEYFQLYVLSLENGFMYDEFGELSPYNFRSVIVTGLRLGKYDWVESFIKEYQERLPVSQRDNAVTFNMASLYFYKKDYREVISLLQEVEYDDFTYNLNSKTMLLLTYYEVDEIEPLLFLADSFRAFLSRHKEIPASRRKSFNDLIKFVKRLAKIIPGDTKAIEKLHSDIEATKGIASEQWLRAKVAEMR